MLVSQSKQILVSFPYDKCVSLVLHSGCTGKEEPEPGHPGRTVGLNASVLELEEDLNPDIYFIFRCRENHRY